MAYGKLKAVRERQSKPEKKYFDTEAVKAEVKALCEKMGEEDGTLIAA